MATYRTVCSWVLISFLAVVADAARLRGPVVNGKRFDFGLDAETNAIYLVERSTNLIDWSVVVRNDDLTTNRSFSFTNNLPRAFFRTRQTNEPLFQFALAARQGITLDGQNIRMDSFDSGDPNYSDGYGHYTNNPISKWKVNGNLACNDTITNPVSIANANIYGHVTTGPYGPVSVGSVGMIGDKAWQSNSANFGKIQPGWLTTNAILKFPSVIVPTNLYGATPPSGLHLTTNGITYDIVLGQTGATNDYNLQGQTLIGNIYVRGIVRLLVTAGINMSGRDRITLEPGAYLHLYADCVSSSLGGNGVQNPGTAEHFCYFGTDRNTSLSYGGNATFTGVFYAPNADMQMGGGGSTVVDFVGSAIARSIKFTGNFNIHFDENLPRVGLVR